MTFVLNGTGGNPSPHRNAVVNCLTKLVGINPTELVEANFNFCTGHLFVHNTSMQLPAKGPILLERIDRADSGYWLTLQLQEKFGIHFEFDTKGETRGAHSLIRNLFDTKQLNPSSNHYKSMRDVGLGVPDEIPSYLTYQIPLKVWHGLPESFVEHIIEGSFLLDGLCVHWPRHKSIAYTTLENRRKEAVVHDSSYHKPEVIELLNALLSHNLFRREIKQDRGQVIEDRLLCNEPVTMRTLVEIENCLTTVGNEHSLPQDNSSFRFSLNGQIPAKELLKVPSAYDAFLENAGFSLSAFNLCIGKTIMKRTSADVFILADLETAARLAAVLPFDSNPQLTAYDKTAKFSEESPKLSITAKAS